MNVLLIALALSPAGIVLVNQALQPAEEPCASTFTAYYNSLEACDHTGGHESCYAGVDAEHEATLVKCEKENHGE